MLPLLCHDCSLISTEFVQQQAEPRAECREFLREVQGHCEESGEVIDGREGSQ